MIQSEGKDPSKAGVKNVTEYIPTSSARFKED